MQEGADGRAALIDELGAAARMLGTRQALLDQAAAERLGIRVTDLQCLGAIDLTGPLSAGRLAEVTGLTTGAITGITDRLEQAGFVRRVADPADRRRVIIEPVPGRRTDVGEVYRPALEVVWDWCAGRTEEELRVVLDYLRTSGGAMPELTARLREENAAGRTRKRPGRAV